MRFVWPLPPGPQANRIDAGFLDPDYPKWRKQMGLPPDEHPGVDINLSGTSGNIDEGYPVVAVLPGIVAHVGQHRVWGNIVLLRHPDHIAKALGYPKLYTQYAHLKFACVKEGDYLMAGEPVGSIGRGDPLRPFTAHLHFEMRIADLPPDYWPKTRDNIIGRYLDPKVMLEKYASYERRYFYPVVKLYGPRIDGVYQEGVVNLNDPSLAHLRVK